MPLGERAREQLVRVMGGRRKGKEGKKEGEEDGWSWRWMFGGNSGIMECCSNREEG